MIRDASSKPPPSLSKSTEPISKAVNTGSAAFGCAPSRAAGGNGGPGIVILRGPSAVTFTASPSPSATISTHPGGDKLAKFTSTGTLTIS